MPIIYSNLLNSDLFWTNAEVSVGKKWLKWEEVTLNWENVHLNWDEVFILLEVAQLINRGGNSGTLYKEYVDGNPWKQLRKEIGEEKTKKVIKVFCRVKGIEYEESKTSESDEKIKVTVNEFERFVKEAINVKIDF